MIPNICAWHCYRLTCVVARVFGGTVRWSVAGPAHTRIRASVPVTPWRRRVPPPMPEVGPGELGVADVAGPQRRRRADGLVVQGAVGPLPALDRFPVLQPRAALVTDVPGRAKRRRRQLERHPRRPRQHHGGRDVVAPARRLDVDGGQPIREQIAVVVLPTGGLAQMGIGLFGGSAVRQPHLAPLLDDVKPLPADALPRREVVVPGRRVVAAPRRRRDLRRGRRDRRARRDVLPAAVALDHDPRLRRHRPAVAVANRLAQRRPGPVGKHLPVRVVHAVVGAAARLVDDAVQLVGVGTLAVRHPGLEIVPQRAAADGRRQVHRRTLRRRRTAPHPHLPVAVVEIDQRRLGRGLAMLVVQKHPAVALDDRKRLVGVALTRRAVRARDVDPVAVVVDVI